MFRGHANKSLSCDNRSLSLRASTMSHQLIFAGSEFNNNRRKTHRELFLSRMNELMHWDQLEVVIEPYILNWGIADEIRNTM